MQGGGGSHASLRMQSLQRLSLPTAALQNWENHWCEKYYVPLTAESKRAFVPDWVFNASDPTVVAQSAAVPLRMPATLLAAVLMLACVL